MFTSSPLKENEKFEVDGKWAPGAWKSCCAQAVNRSFDFARHFKDQRFDRS